GRGSAQGRSSGGGGRAPANASARASASACSRERSSERKPLGRSRMREEQHVRPARRRKIPEVVAGERDVRVLVGGKVVGELERPPVRLALVAAEERGERRQPDELETGEEQERDGE